MTKEELNLWLAEAKLVDSESEFDGNGNHEESRIYEHNGQLFRMAFQNGGPCEKRGEKGRLQGVYEPRMVVRETQMVEVVKYRFVG
jgi:hypothetical protein